MKKLNMDIEKLTLKNKINFIDDKIDFNIEK